MTAITYLVEVDWARDGFGGASSIDDVTDYFKRADSSQGIEDVIRGRVANVGTLNLTLNNTDYRFSPGNSASPYTNYGWLNLPVRITLSHLGDDHVVWTGYTRTWTPDSGTASDRECVVACVDLAGVLQEQRVSLPLMRDQRSDQLIKHLINGALRSALAEGDVTFSGQVSDGDSVTLDGTGYTFKTSAVSANQVTIGADVYATIDNLVGAVNGGAGVYGSGSERPDWVTAEFTPSFYERMRNSYPVRWYRFGESAGTVAEDRGGNGRDGTYSGVTLGQTGALGGDPDKAISFDGVDDYVSLPQIAVKNTAFSVEVWVKPNSSSPPASQCLWCLRGAEDSKLVIVPDGGSINVQYTAASGQTMNTTGGLVFDAWSQVVITYDYAADVSKLYVNGALVTSGTAGPVSEDKTAFYVGASQPGTEHYKGLMDECGLWLRTVTAEEVAARYAGRNQGIGVVVKARLRGKVGDGYTLAKSGANITVEGASLSGGDDLPTTISYETGKQTFTLAGDGWRGGNTLAAIEDVSRSEIGLFWISRAGVPVFKNREWFLKQAGTASAMSFSSRAISSGGMEDYWTQFLVQLTPRETISTGVVAKANSSIEVKPVGEILSDGEGHLLGSRYNPHTARSEQATHFRLDFVDQGTGQVVSAENLVLPPVANTDFTASDDPDAGEGFDYSTSSQLSFQVMVDGSGLEVEAKTTTLGPLFVHGFQVRGDAIVAYDPIEIIREDSAGVTAYGDRQLGYMIPLPVDARLGESLAEHLRARYNTPGFRVHSLNLGNQLQVGSASLFDLEIGDVVTVSDTMLGISSKKYLITGVQYGLGVGDRALVQFRVAALMDQTYGLIGNGSYGLVGNNLRLGI